MVSISPDVFTIDLNNPAPRYHQIQENIAELIDVGLLKSGAMLPSERDLSDYYGVSRLTVRQAIEILVQKGLLEKQHGVGTFVRGGKPLTPITPTVMGFSQRMRESGRMPSSRLLEHGIVTASSMVARRLELSKADKVIRLVRLRLADDEPLMIETSYLPESRFPDLMKHDLAKQSLYAIIAREYGVKVHEAEQTLEPTLLTPEEADHFSLPEHSPAMLVRIVAYAADRTPIEFSNSVVRGDRCRYYFRVTTQQPIVS